MSGRREQSSVDRKSGEQANKTPAGHGQRAHGYRSTQKRKRRILDVVRVLVVLIVVVITVVPILWIILSGFKSQGECLHNPPIWIPRNPSWANYQDMWTDGGALSLKNSLIVTVGGTLVAVLGGVLVAYSISRFRTGGQHLANWVLSVKFLPPIAFAIPIATMYRVLHLIDTHFGLILVYGAFNLPFVVWTMKGFMDEVPRQLDESAMIDGCTRIGVMWRIVLPLSAPGLVSATLLTFIFIWSEYLFALVLGQNELFTVPVRLSSYYSQAEGWVCAPQAALATLAILPMIAMAFIGQRFIVRAMTFGAVKQ